MKTIRITTLLLFALFLFKQAEGQYEKVNSKGLDIYYRVIGQGKPILIIGGGPGDVSDRYLSLCELLSKNYQCILVDQRGTGKSTPAIIDSTSISLALTIEDFEAIRNKLGYKQWTVLGFSYGGFLASVYTYDYPASVSALIHMGSLGFDFNVYRHFSDNIMSRLHPGDLELLKYWSDSTRMAADKHHAIVETIRARMPGYFFSREKALLVTQTMKDSDFNLALGDYLWDDMYKRSLELLKMDSKFDKPVLILHGRQDPLGESVAQALSRYYKNTKLVFIEKSGHYSWIEQPEKVLGAVNNFFNN
jgi:proline iminopeptidase